MNELPSTILDQSNIHPLVLLILDDPVCLAADTPGALVGLIDRMILDLGMLRRQIAAPVPQVSISVARAGAGDIRAALSIMCILQAIATGDHPGLEADDPDYFDGTDPAHLLTLYHLLMRHLREAPGGIGRVILGMNALLDAGVTDPGAERLELHPTIRSSLATASFDPARPGIASQSYQSRVFDWIIVCFGHIVAADKAERNYRFLEEALELFQSLSGTRESALQLVDYVFSRPPGEPAQEVGGVSVTMAGLCAANGIDMAAAGEEELERVWGKIVDIRRKQATKPHDSPLPQ